MADDFYNDEDAYQQRVLRELEPSANPTGGIAGPLDTGFPSPAAPAAPKGTYDMDKFVTGWRDDARFGPSEQGFRDYLAQSPYGAGVQYSGGDSFTAPTGRVHDIMGDYKSGTPTKRTGYTTDARYAAVTGSKPKATATKAAAPIAAPMKSAAPSAAAPAAPAANPFLDQIRQLLLERMGQMKGQPSIGDPELAAQSGAYRRSQQRAGDNERAMLAERAASQGLLLGGQSSGGFDTALQGVQEQIGENTSAFDAGLVGNEVQQRRAEMQQLLNMALQSGDAESARELSMALSKMDLEYRRQALAQQGSQFNADLGYRNRALDQSGSQFNANLGFQQGQWNDQYGRQLGRDYESDYMNRVLLGLG